MSALRALLSDGKRHHAREVERVTGARLAHRLREAHGAVDVSARLVPLHFETEVERGATYYRQTDRAHCEMCAAEYAREVLKALRAHLKRGGR